MARRLEVEVVGNTRDFDQAMDRAGKKTSGFGSKLGSLAKGGAIGGAVAGIGLLAVGLKGSVEAALEAEKAEARFKDAMDKVGASAKQRAAAQEAVNKVSRQAALDDEDLSDVYSKLVRTTGDVEKAQKGMALSADIARARNISLEAASKLVEKAYLGNEQAFKKVGIQVEKGTTATEALEIAQKKFAGSAEAYGKTAAGAQDKLGVAFENLQEKVGQKLLPVLAKLATKLTELITWAEANWPRFAKSIQPAIDALDMVWKAVQVMWKILQPILEVAIPLAFKEIGLAIKIQMEIWKVLYTVVSTVITNILKVVDKFLGGFQAIAEGASHIPFIGDKFKGVADKIGLAREKVRELATGIENLKSKDITITVNTIHHEQSISGGARGGRAAGGPVAAGSAYVVGEKGPELFVPGQSGRIIPNGTMSAAGGSVNHVHVYLDGKEVFSSVQKTSTRKTARGDVAAAFV